MRWTAFMLLALLVFPARAPAQPTLSRDLISAGGFEGMAGSSRLWGSIGGPAFGSATASSILLIEGFWFPRTGTPGSIEPLPMEAFRFRLDPAFPNPTRGRAAVRFAVPGSGSEMLPVRLDIFDILGRRIATLVDGPHAPGVYLEPWQARDASGHPVAPGIYYCRLQAGGATATRSIVILK